MKAGLEVSAAATRRPRVSSPRLGDRLSCHHNPMTGEETRRREQPRRDRDRREMKSEKEKEKLKATERAQAPAVAAAAV